MSKKTPFFLVRSNVPMENSSITGNRVYGGGGVSINILNISNSTIKENEMSGNGGGGIKIGTSINSPIIGNAISGHDNDGIEIDENRNSPVTSNAIFGDNNSGINIRKNLNSMIANNKILGRSNHGIRIVENVESMIANNKIDSSTEDEIRDQAIKDSVLNTESLLAIVDNFQLDIDNKKNLISDLTVIEKDLKSKQPEISKIEKAYLSAWKILEMVAASVIYYNFPDMATIVDSFMTRVLFFIILG